MLLTQRFQLLLTLLHRSLIPPKVSFQQHAGLPRCQMLRQRTVGAVDLPDLRMDAAPQGGAGIRNRLAFLDHPLPEPLKPLRVEDLAENEQIYSARFMGNTAYFVTFRQTDPLFAVDLTDIENPTVLSELKVSGFSEYLHSYGEGLLFGFGIEADEETGRQEGMKLSMFDISDNTNVQEITRLPLDKYNYSEALYNHHALMIQPNKNIIGFEAEGSDRGGYWKDYLIFTYENDVFVQKLKIRRSKQPAVCKRRQNLWWHRRYVC